MATFNCVFSNNTTLSRSQFTPPATLFFLHHPSLSSSRPSSLSSFKSFHFLRRKLVTESEKPWRHPAVAYVHASAKGSATTDGNNANKRTTLSIGIIGASGKIGTELLNQLRDQAPELKEERNIDLCVTGITNTKKMLLSKRGFDLATLMPLEKPNPERKDADLQKFVDHIHHGNHGFFSNKVLIDCTANEDVAFNYAEWMRKGIHIITPNKKANSGSLEQYSELRTLQQQSNARYFYEATVGAGLPIISTLKSLLETGDKIETIEGVFSGTLSYIFNNFKGGRKFSKVVTEAKEAGYTEPDPRDDLSGTDVARKVLILARECRLKLEPSHITPVNLVPEPLTRDLELQAGEDVGKGFMRRLTEFDDDMAKTLQAAENEGKVLRYVGVVDVSNKEGRVELKRYEKDHPFSQLSGSDNIILFTTKRYKHEQPLIVRGPGAGAEVTAGGVFSDILHLSSYLSAPS